MSDRPFSPARRLPLSSRQSVTLRRGRRSGNFQLGVIQVHCTQLHRGFLRTSVRRRDVEIYDFVGLECMLHHQSLQLAIRIAPSFRTHQKGKTDGDAVGQIRRRVVLDVPTISPDSISMTASAFFVASREAKYTSNTSHL